MSVLDFLFEGKPPVSVTTYGTSTQNLPQWMSDYTQGLIARANAVAAEGYMPYQAPRIAGFTQDQTAAQDLTRTNVGAYKPALQKAGALTTAGAQKDIAGATQPFVNAANQDFPGAADAYMDPYIGNVIDRAKLEANRNFSEKIMPALDNKFTSAGQYRSSAHMREADRAGRDLTEGLQATSMGALSQAFQNAGTQFQQDRSRDAQLASITGDIAAREGSLNLEGGRQMAALGESAQTSGLRDAAGLAAVGQERQGLNQRNLDLGYSDFQAQRDFPRNQVDWLSTVIRGLPTPMSTSTTQTGPANSYQPSPLAQIGALISAGQGISDLFRNEDGGKARGGLIKKKMPMKRGALSLCY